MKMPVELLLQHLAQCREILALAYHATPANLRDARPPAGGWSIAQIVEHLAITDDLMAKFLAKNIAELGHGQREDVDIDAILQKRRLMAVLDRRTKVEVREQPKAQPGDPNQIGAPTPGLITGLFVAAGDEVKRNDKLLSLEAMKMQSTIYAPKDGKIARLLVEPGQQVEAKDLLIVIE